MESSTLSDDNDIQAMRDLIARLSSKSTIIDFDEQIQLSTVRNTARIWKDGDKIVGFAYVDTYNNLWFETEPEYVLLDKLENEIVQWSVACTKRHNTETGTENSLDCSCSADNSHRINLLDKHGFIPQDVRSLLYSRLLSQPIMEYPLPVGFSIRCVNGKNEVEKLVSLHRAAFGTDNMTIEERLAMMSTPLYKQEMDLVAVAPNDELAAFCVCGFDDPNKNVGHTDPIGTHPRYQRMGLGKAIISAGLIILKNSGANVVEIGTSSENAAMQNLANELGFVCISEKLWFSKTIS